MKKIYLAVVGIGLSFFMEGCATSGTPAPGVYGNVAQALSRCESDCEEDWQTNGYRTGTKSIVGSRQKDARVVLDAGKVLKVWVAPYTQKTTLVAAHDIYTIVESPHFVVGETVPSGRGSKRQSYKEQIPFVIKEKYIETVSAGGNGKSSKKRGGKYDAAIKRYIK